MSPLRHGMDTGHPSPTQADTGGNRCPWGTPCFHWKSHKGKQMPLKNTLLPLEKWWTYFIWHEMYLYFLLFLFIKMAHVVEINPHGAVYPFLSLPCLLYPELVTQGARPITTMLTLNVRGPSYFGLTRSISWLLMPWLLTSPGHQQPWYWLCRMGWLLSYLRKDFNYLCHISVE